MNLSDIVGQPHAVTCLTRAIKSRRIGHAYLFFGPPGVGKKTAALAFARALNCERPLVPGTGCGECVPCREIESGAFPDMMVVLPEGDEERENTFHTEQISAIIARASMTASPARWKVFILEDIHLIRGDTANRLLKIIEEPPPHTIFLLLTSEPDRVLPTIRSRCQRIRFGLLSRPAVVEIMRRHKADGGEAGAELMMGQVDRPPEEIAEVTGRAEEFLGMASRFDLAGICARSKEIAKDTEELSSLLDGLERVCGVRLRTETENAGRWVDALDAVALARQRLRRYADKTLVDALGAELALVLRRDTHG